MGSEMCIRDRKEPAPWLALRFEGLVEIKSVVLYNRKDGHGSRTRNVEVRLTETRSIPGDQMLRGGHLIGQFVGPGQNGGEIKIEVTSKENGRFVLIQMNSSEYLNLQHVQVEGYIGCLRTTGTTTTVTASKTTTTTAKTPTNYIKPRTTTKSTTKTAKTTRTTTINYIKPRTTTSSTSSTTNYIKPITTTKSTTKITSLKTTKTTSKTQSSPKTKLTTSAADGKIVCRPSKNNLVKTLFYRW